MMPAYANLVDDAIEYGAGDLAIVMVSVDSCVECVLSVESVD